MSSKTWCRLLVLLLLSAATAEFAVRGPVRLMTEGAQWNDFLSPYIQAKAWMLGGNPYSADELVSLWPSDNPRPLFVDRDRLAGVLAKKRGIPSPYPLTTFFLLYPFARFSWPIALRLWAVLNLTAVLGSFLALLSICGASWRDLRSQIFLAIAFALAPIHTGLATANPAMLAVALTIGTVWAEHFRRENTAGILLALAVCLKPPLGLCLLFYYLVRRRWGIVTTATAMSALIAIASVVRLAYAGIAWLPAYRRNIADNFGLGALDDFSTANPARFNMINLQVVFSSLFGNRSIADAMALGCGAVLLGIWLWLLVKRQRHEVLELSALFVLSLLPVYHRFYDAGLLLWPLCWSVLVVTKRSLTLLVVVLLSPFLFPGAAFLDGLLQSGKISRAIADRWWWNAIVMPHEAWAVMLLSILFLYFISVRPSQAVRL